MKQVPVQSISEELLAKWGPVLNHADLPAIKDKARRDTTAVLLENTESALREAGAFVAQSLTEAAPVNATGAEIDNFDPVLISLVRRSAPNLMAYDIMGVQPMTGPTGLVFAMRSRVSNQTGAEVFYNEANTGISATKSAAANNNAVGGADSNRGTLPAGVANDYNFEAAAPTADAEALGGNATFLIPEMAFSIEKVTVTAKSRALKAEYTIELAQDLKAVHGLDAESELSNILSTELLAEINRECVRTVNLTAVRGSAENVTTAGTFDLDTDANGRWSVEKFKGLMFQIEREANKIAKDTRRGKGNLIICSSDVASALQMAGVLDYTPALAGNNLAVDDTGQTFVGILNGRFKVYIDPYSAGGNYMTVGYKGSSAFDAGLF